MYCSKCGWDGVSMPYYEACELCGDIQLAVIAVDGALMPLSAAQVAKVLSLIEEGN